MIINDDYAAIKINSYPGAITYRTIFQVFFFFFFFVFHSLSCILLSVELNIAFERPNQLCLRWCFFSISKLRKVRRKSALEIFLYLKQRYLSVYERLAECVLCGS